MNVKLYFKRADKYFGSPNDMLNADMMDAMDYFKVSDMGTAECDIKYGTYRMGYIIWTNYTGLLKIGNRMCNEFW